MVNLVAAVKPLLHRYMKMAGVVPQAVEIEPGTVINIWVPKHKKTTFNQTITTATSADAKTKTKTKTKTKSKTTKPVVVLVHGFAADGITTWVFQVHSLIKRYDVYVPDLLFFGGSATDKHDRSAAFQAECLAKALRKVGVERCTVVGFSYGGMVAFKMAELEPELVGAVVGSGTVTALTESVNSAMLERLRYPSLPELLLPETVEGCKALLRVAMHKKLRFPNRLYKDFIQSVFRKTKEKVELLDGLVVTTTSKDGIFLPKFNQRIHLLWGEQDQIFGQQLAKNLKEELGDKATYEGIKKAGHLVHAERPCVYNRCLNNFLASLHAHAHADIYTHGRPDLKFQTT